LATLPVNSLAGQNEIVLTTPTNLGRHVFRLCNLAMSKF